MEENIYQNVVCCIITLELTKLIEFYEQNFIGADNMYGVIAYLDSETEQKINDLRDGLGKEGIVGHGMRPHVTLSTHPDIDIESFIVSFQNYFNDIGAVPLFFPTLAIFLNSGTLYAAPTKNSVLTDFHQRYHDQFKKEINQQSLYIPDYWVPHCTLVMNLSHEDLVKAFDYSARNLEPFHATIESVALIQLTYEADICIDVKDILTVKLKKGDVN
ncbi:2'-5' RNA ligase [Fictibacillus halophilus]|uniref:2'-5' RNA ligase n=1 Tax=Fictibacillus halophilus TaxID=1610490 RepID=A0ABV2LLW4_9BACL|nr:2'-5' RNA ligase family protein [Fictibacillus halophilus]